MSNVKRRTSNQLQLKKNCPQLSLKQGSVGTLHVALLVNLKVSLIQGLYSEIFAHSQAFIVNVQIPEIQ